MASAQWKHLKSTWKVLEILNNLAKYLSTSTSTIHKQKKYLRTSTSTHKIVLKLPKYLSTIVPEPNPGTNIFITNLITFIN